MNSAVLPMTWWLCPVRSLDVFDRIAPAVNSGHRVEKSSPRPHHKKWELVAVRRATVPVWWAARSIRWGE